MFIVQTIIDFLPIASINGNQAYVELPSNCYFHDGSYTLTIKLVKDDVEQTLVIFDGQIAETITDSIVENESVINATYFIQQDWLQRIETAAETALQQANNAAASATEAKEAADKLSISVDQMANGNYKLVFSIYYIVIFCYLYCKFLLFIL